MPNMLDTAMGWLDTTLKTSSGDTIVYQRGSSTVSITAVVGKTDGERMDSGGSAYSFTSTDFIIEAEDLVLDGEIILPQRGDRIVYGGGVYTVLANSSGEKPYANSTPDGSTLRIYAKLTGES